VAGFVRRRNGRRRKCEEHRDETAAYRNARNLRAYDAPAEHSSQANVTSLGKARPWLDVWKITTGSLRQRFGAR